MQMILIKHQMKPVCSSIQGKELLLHGTSLLTLAAQGYESHSATYGTTNTTTPNTTTTTTTTRTIITTTAGQLQRWGRQAEPQPPPPPPPPQQQQQQSLVSRILLPQMSASASTRGLQSAQIQLNNCASVLKALSSEEPHAEPRLRWQASHVWMHMAYARLTSTILKASAS